MWMPQKKSVTGTRTSLNTCIVGADEVESGFTKKGHEAGGNLLGPRRKWDSDKRDKERGK